MSTLLQEIAPERAHHDLDWDDPTSYQWTLRIPKWDTGDVIGGIVGGFFGGAIVYPLIVAGLLWSISLLSAPFAFWTSAVATTVFFLVLIMHVYLSWWGKPHERKDARSIVYWVAIVCLGGLLAMLSIPQSPMGALFRNGAGASFWQWCLYFVDNTMNVVVLDIPEVFAIRFSNVTYDHWGSCVATVVVRVLITIGIIELLLEMFRTKYREQKIYGTVKECYWHCESLPDNADLLLTRVAQITKLSQTTAVDAKAFVEEFKERAKLKAAESEKENESQ